MRLVTAAALAAALLALPSAADAATVSNDGGTLTYKGTVAEANSVTVSGTPTSITISDPGKTIDLLDGPCTIALGIAICSRSNGFNAVEIDTDGDSGTDTAPDSITSTLTGFPENARLGVPENVVLRGSSGPLTIQGGSIGEIVVGGAGATLRGGGGGDGLQLDPGSGGTAAGGDGDDTFFLTATGASADGGAGSDQVYFGTPDGTDPATAPITARVNADAATAGNGFPGQNETLANVEGLVGGSAADDLSATGDADNTLVGLGGGDRLDPGPGEDFVYADQDGTFFTEFLAANLYPAPDAPNTITTTDGATDVVTCGAGREVVSADSFDLLRKCPAEGAGTTLTRPAPVVQQVPVPVPAQTPVGTAPPRDTTRPTATLAAPAPKAKTLRKTGAYAVALTPSEAVAAQVTLTAKAGKLVSIASVGDVVLATRAAKAAAGKKTSVRLRVSKTLRKLLKAKRRLTITATLTDAAGNVTTVTRTVRIRK